MRVTVQPEWPLVQAIEAAFDAYRGIGTSSRGYRISVLLLWANVVGRERACAELSALKVDAGGWDGLAESLEVGRSTVDRLRRRFAAMPQTSRFAWTLEDEDAAKRFDWGERIGSGGSGEVWRAVDALNRDVAVKFMSDPGSEAARQAL